MSKLSEKPILSGLSRNKIFIIGSIIFGAAFVAIGFGTIYEYENTSVADGTDQTYNNSTNQSVDSVLSSSDQKIAQENALQSAQLNQLTTDGQQSSAPVATNVVDKPQIQNSGDIIVPPINDTNAQQHRAQEIQIENQFKLKQLQNVKSAYSAKTVLYTNNQDKVAASGALVNTSSNLSRTQNNQATATYPQSETGLASTEGANSSLSSLNSTNLQHQEQNNQNEKQNFARNSADKTVNGQSSQYLSSRITELISPYVLSAGSVIPSTMISGLNSDLPGQIVGMVKENIYDSPTHRILLIPQGAKLIGLYDSKVTYGQERILVAWNRLIYPDGSSINLKAMPGTDIEGYAGFYDEVDNHYWKIFGSSFIMGVITAAMQYSQNNTNANVQSGGLGFTNPDPSVGQTLSGSLGQQLGQTGLSLAQKNINIQPTLIVKPGYPFNVMITADMVLRPYKKVK